MSIASSPVRAQAAQPAVVVIQTYQVGNATRMVISRGEGKAEEVEYKFVGKQPVLPVDAYQQVFAKLYQEGYVLTSTFSPGTTQVVTLVFTKSK